MCNGVADAADTTDNSKLADFLQNPYAARNGR
jgi:hypothetical protein